LIFLNQAFFLETMLCILFQIKCVFKKSETLIEIWFTGGSEESISFIKFINVAILTTSVAYLYSMLPTLSPRASTAWCPGCFALLFSSQTCKKKFKDNQNPHDQVIQIISVSALYVYP
jgi:hypothetical protein